MANLYDKAGLVNIPVGYQDGFLYNIKPTDNTLGFRFNRDSAATRVNKEGLIEQVGYFGPELVQNGDFSELGNELIPDGNFTNQAAVDYWQIADTGGVERATKSLENGFMRLTYDIASGSALYKSGIVTSGKSYKVTFRAKGTANSNFNSIGDNVNIPSNPQYVVSNPTLTDDWQNYEFYVPVSSTVFRLYLASAQIGDTLDITNISIKQVDPNDYWTLGGNAWSITDKLSADGTQTTGTNSYQSQTFDSGKTYKVVFTCTIQAGNLDVRLQGGGSTVLGTTRTTSGTYTQLLTSTGNTSLRFRGNEDFIGSITNISAIEVLGDKPRIDYTDSLTSPSFLLEPQSTNLLTFSEDFSQWTNYSQGTGSLVTLTSNYSISPDGTKNASRIQCALNGGNTSSDRSYIKLSGFSGTPFSCAKSLYVKNNLNVQQTFFIGVNAVSDRVTLPVSNKWQRLKVEGGVLNTEFRIGIIGGSLNSDSIDIDIFAAQIETLSYATSYIPTAGSTVTRAEETCVGAGNASTFNDAEGVLYAEIAALANDGTSRRISISAGNTNNNNLVSLIYGISNRISPSIYSGGSFQMGGDYTLPDQTETIKVALKYSTNDAALWVNGLEVLTDTSVTTPVGLDQIKFEYGNGSNKFYGKTKGIYVFNEALTDDELQQLTGPEYNSFAALAAAYNYTVI